MCWKVIKPLRHNYVRTLPTEDHRVVTRTMDPNHVFMNRPVDRRSQFYHRRPFGDLRSPVVLNVRGLPPVLPESLSVPFRHSSAAHSFITPSASVPNLHVQDRPPVEMQRFLEARQPFRALYEPRELLREVRHRPRVASPSRPCPAHTHTPDLPYSRRCRLHTPLAGASRLRRS